MALQDAITENEDVKKKALLRLAVAGLVTTAALAGLWWLDQDKAGKPAPAPTPALPAPITPAPMQEAAPPRSEAEPEVEAEVESAPEATTESAPAQVRAEAAPEAPPPPPRVSNQAGPRLPPAAQPSPRAATTPPTPAPTPAPSTRPAPPPGTGYVVQLGVFSNPENARELVEHLAKRGIRAHMETRVQLGPFLNRAEAEKAQAEMRRLGYAPLVTPASATR